MAGKREKEEPHTVIRFLLLFAMLAGLTVSTSAPPAVVSPVMAEEPVVAMPELEEVPAESGDEIIVPAEPVRPETMVITPAEEPVDAAYFTDTVFVGDSRTHGLQLYGGMTEAQYLHAVGATAESVFTKKTQETEQGTVPILDALAEMEVGKVYIMLGVNELGWPQTEKFYEQYGKIIDRVREDHPDAQVVIQSILPVSAKQDAKGTYVNNKRINTFNALLEELAIDKLCPYLNVAESVSDENGCLRSELTGDGVHLNTKGCKVWIEYLKSHPLPETT